MTMTMTILLILSQVGSFFTGFALDKFGAKGGLILNFVASAISYYILSQSTSMDILYLSKVPGYVIVRGLLWPYLELYTWL